MDPKVFLTAFTTLFLAELGDKTQLAVICLSASSRKPLSVFLGAAISLSVVTALGALFGHCTAQFVPQNIIKRVAAVLFVGIGIWMWVRP